MNVLITFPPNPPDDWTERCRAAFPDATVTVCPYEEPAEVRSARGRGDVVAADAVAPLSDTQREAYAAAEVLLAWDVPAGLSALAPNLRWIQAIGAGVEHLQGADLPPEVLVTTAAGISAVPIAEFVIGRLIAVWKRFADLADVQRRHEWKSIYGENVAGKRMVVVGFGAIGRAVAVRAHALGMTVVAVRRRPDADERPTSVDDVVGPDRLHEVLASADAVVVAAPATAETRHLVDEAAFAAMKPGAVFVNVARGTLVDEAALIAALTSGHLRAAVLDVTEHEPLPADSPLWDTPGVFLSAHCSTVPSGYLDALLDLFTDNLDRYRRGDPLRNATSPAS